jgi:hypothetical protein
MKELSSQVQKIYVMLGTVSNPLVPDIISAAPAVPAEWLYHIS